MIKFTKSIHWICVLLLFPIFCIFPQQADFKFQHLTTADGLPTNLNYHIYQDHLGFLWFSNYNGLARYDGYNFKIYLPDSTNPYSIGGSFILRMAEDSKGNLWISTRINGVDKLDRKTEQFFHYLHDPQNSNSLSSNDVFTSYMDISDRLWIVHRNGFLDMLDTKTGIVRRCRHRTTDLSSISHNVIATRFVGYFRLAALYEDVKGNIWLGTNGGGLNRYDKNTNSFISFKHNTNDQNSISCDTVTCIYQDKDNNLWIGTWGGGLNRYLPETNTFIHYRHNNYDKNTIANDYCLNIFEDKSNNLWLSVKNCLSAFNYKKNTFTHYKYVPDDPYSLSNDVFAIPLYEDDSDLIWFLIGEKPLDFCTIDVFNPQERKFFHYKDDLDNPYGLQGMFFSSLYKDHSENVWISTINRGINKWNPFRQNFVHIYHEHNNPNSLCSNSSYAILESLSIPDVIWVATKDGLSRYNQRSGMFSHLKHHPTNSNSLVNNHINDLFEDKSGILWIATVGGLSCYDIKRDQFKNYVHAPNRGLGLATDVLWTICEDHEGMLWLGTIDKGLIRFQRKTNTFTNYIYDPADSQSISPGYVWCIHEDRNEILWIGTSNGLNKFNRENQTFTHYLSNRDIFVIHEDKRNNFWLGTRWDGLGLFNRQTGEATFYDQKYGLCNNKINTIIEDDAGFLWLGTEGGLSKFDTITEVFTNFSREHGLPTLLFNCNGTKIKNGQIWLATIDNGIVGFYPKQIKINTIPPKIVLTDIKLFNKSLKISTDLPLKQDISVTRQITFAHWQNDISMECTALHFGCPEKNQYAFWLENYDKDWYYTGTNRYTSYTNLDPGEYILHAKGANCDNVWNEEGVSLKIIINPPWWQAWWAYGIYLLIISSIVLITWRTQLRRIYLRNELKMKQFEMEKLKELDHLKSRFFANISHEFRTPLTLILGPIEKLLLEINNPKWKNMLQITSRNSQQLLRLINQLLDFSKLEAGRMSLRAKEHNIIPLINGILFSFASLAERKQIILNFNTEQTTMFVYIDQDKMEKILANLLSNAFKFTLPGGMISIQLSKKTGKKGEWLFAAATEEMVEIKISDTGIGIEAKHLNHIFDRYYQVDDKNKGTGTGIGLALTKELVELHHGKISVQSELGKGSQFTIYIPLGKAHLKQHEIIDEKPIETLEKEGSLPETVLIEQEITKIQHSKAKIRRLLPIVLIVEDNQDVRNYIRDFLGSDYRIKEAHNGKDGFDKATDTIPDLIISDVMMPTMDGFELCEKLKTDERTCHIPVILLTARTSESSKLEGLETGADDYLIKPFSARELQIRIKNLIDQRKKLRERFSHESALKPKDIAVTSSDEKFMQKLIHIIENNIADSDFSVDNLGKEIGLSHSQLHRKMRALINKSPIEFIRILRLKRAASLLKQQYGNVSEIAYEVGFNNPAYFAECFRKLFGVSPSEYAAHASSE